MRTISILSAKELLNSVAFEMFEPVMLWGEPGVGKSEMVNQLSDENDALMIDVRLSQYDSVDLRGIPSVQTGLTVWNVPSTLPFKGNPRFDATAKRITLFLDEINSAAPAVAAVAYQLVNDRRVGEHELMDNVVIIAAGNRDGDKGVTNKMPTPLANRFTHVEIGVDVESWTDWAGANGVAPEGIAFINFRKPLLSTFMVTKAGKPVVTMNKAFATPRTWAKAFRYFASTTMSPGSKVAAMAGAVGDAEATEFMGFVEIYQQIRNLVPTILKSPTTAEVPAERSLMYAVAVALSGEMSLNTVGNVHKYLMRLDAEFVILAWLLSTRRDESLMTTPEFMDYAKKYKRVFSDK